MAVAGAISDKWYGTRDMWHVTFDIWHVTHDLIFFINKESMKKKTKNDGPVRKGWEIHWHYKTSQLRRLQAQTLPDETPPIGKIHSFIK